MIRDTGRRWQLRLAGPLLGCLAVALLAGPTPASAAGFCEAGVVTDYSAPFAAMPALRPFPERNELPFGPGRLSVAEVRHPMVMTQETTLGFSLEYGADAAGPARLSWLVAGSLVRLSRDGRSGRVVEKRVRKIVRMQPGSRVLFRFPVAADPSLYRLELDFHGPSGKRLGRFGEYLRVMRPDPDLRLSLSGTAFRPGETVSTCIENFGNQELTFGACDPGFERFDGVAWTRFPAEPVPCIAIAYFLGAGRAKQGSSLRIPVDAPAGPYRATMGGATAEFQVLAPG